MLIVSYIYAFWGKARCLKTRQQTCRGTITATKHVDNLPPPANQEPPEASMSFFRHSPACMRDSSSAVVFLNDLYVHIVAAAS